MAWTSIQTDAGRALIASAFGKELNYTRIKLGSGSVDISQLAAQTDVTDYVKDISIVEYKSAGPVSSVFGRVDNKGIVQPTPFAQMGVFANVDGGEDVLLVIYQDDIPFVIPTPDKHPWNFEPQLNIVTGNVSSFSAVIDWNAYAKLGDVSKIVLSPTRPEGNWTLWLKDEGEIPDYPEPDDPVETIMLDTAPLDAPGDFAIMYGEDDGETVLNFTDNPETAGDDDIIIGNS